jgi:hypothetical protein
LQDSELCSQRGNCHVHFYEKGQSRRGPSLKIPLERIYSARFASLFVLFHTELARTSLNEHFGHESIRQRCDLYISAPDESSRKDAFTWHITTRNFFAFILGRPVVGVSLGQTLIELRERLDIFRPNDPRNHGDFMAYLERLGYLEFGHCPDYSLALLNFAEHYKMKNLWVDAFVHCVGMNEALGTRVGFREVSPVTHALITRAYLEMDLHLERVTRALRNFLEDDFSASQFGASSAARIHLDHFRTFLHEFYVAKFGYWPPPKGSRFTKSLYKSMYLDFRSLYDYLVDLDSSDSLLHQKPASGGICVLQNVKAFDDRHNFIPLPHPHPLLPLEAPLFRRGSANQGSLMRTFMLGAKPNTSADMAWARDALVAATNCSDAAITNVPLVGAYQRFERDYMRKPEEKVSVTDARKVRWLLIYGTLQMLISVIRAPKEVRMTETNYPLCCLVTGAPPWEAGTKALNSEHTPSVLPPKPATKSLDVVSAISIHPDCEASHYLSTPTPLPAVSAGRRLSSTSSQSDVSPTPSSRSSLFRTASIRSVMTLSSSIGSISSYRSSSRRRSLGPTPVKETTSLSHVPNMMKTIPKPSTNFCEILVHGYGNGLNEAPQVIPSELSAEIFPEIVISLQSQPRSPLWKETQSEGPLAPRPRSSRRSETRQELDLNTFTANGGWTKTNVPEPSRTPLMDGFDRGLPGLEEMSDSSTRSSSSGAPVTPIWSSSRPNSPHGSVSSQVATESMIVENRAAHEEFLPASPSFTESSFSISTPLSPTSPVKTQLALPISPRTSLIHSKKSMDLPMVVDIEEMRVYQPTGVPSLGITKIAGTGDDDEEFPDRERSKRWSVASKTLVPIVSVPLKSSLRRTRTAASNATKKRSVRIDGEPVEWATRFRSVTFKEVSN